MARVSIRDVAERAGVSPGTVSAVMNHKGFVSEPLTQRVLDAVEELGYRPNHVARSLRRQRTETVAVLISTILSPFFPPVLTEIDNLLSDAGLSMILGNTKDNEATEATLITLMHEKRADGLLIVPSAPANLPLLEELVREGVAVVTFHSEVAAGRLDCVTWDDFGGSYAAVRHLIEAGRRRIAVYSSLTPARLPRLRGYEAALREAGIVPDPALYLAGGSTEQLRSLTGGSEAILRAIEQPNPPDAIFIASSSFMTFGLLSSIKEKGIRVPEDLAIVTYDNYPWAEHVTPPLSVVARDRAMLGRTAAELLLHRLKDGPPGSPETIVLPTELIIRGSSAGK